MVPAPDPLARREHVVLQGETPNPVDVPPGCRFHPRCPQAVPECKEVDPPEVRVGDQHTAACLLLR